jgi:hypothetical protein
MGKLSNLALCCAITLIGPVLADDAGVFTLYRNSLLDDTARIHVASFDAAEGEPYNLENCNLIASLMQEQPEVKTRFWCERGRYRRK